MLTGPDHLLHPAVAAALERLGVTAQVLECDPDLADTASFCTAYSVDPWDTANCILVAGRGPERPVCACVILATTRVDVNRCVVRLLGVRRASFAGADETAALSGMLLGGVTPFGLPGELPVYVDSRVMQRAAVVIGGGTRNSKLHLAPAELRRLPGAAVVPGLALEPSAPPAPVDIAP